MNNIKIYTSEGKEKAIEQRMMLNQDDEKEKIIHYLLKTWQGVDKENISTLVQIVWDTFLPIAMLHYDSKNISAFATRVYVLRQDKSLWTSAVAQMNDSDFYKMLSKDTIGKFPATLLMINISLPKLIEDYSNFNYHVKSLENKLKNSTPVFSKLQPKGWDEALIKYKQTNDLDFDAPSVKLNEDFGGVYAGGNGVAEFAVRVSLPWAIYDKQEQNRSLLNTLIWAIANQTVTLVKHNNTIALLQSLEQFENNIKNPKYWHSFCATLPEVKSENKLVCAFWDVVRHKLQLENDPSSLAFFDDFVATASDLSAYSNKENKPKI